MTAIDHSPFTTSPSIAIYHVSKTTKDAAFFFAGAYAVLQNAAGQAAYRQRLDPHLTGSTQGSKEKTFAAEDGIFDAANKLNVVVYNGLKSDNAPGVHLQQFAGLQVTFQHKATRMAKGKTITFQ